MNLANTGVPKKNNVKTKRIVLQASIKIRFFKLLAASLFHAVALAEESAEQALALNLEDLLQVQVTSVAKKAQSLSDAPAAIFVISHDDIKRSGVTSLPEALRLAPGVNVARISANKWAISARGFNGSFANKLLVLIDGRSVYSPGFSGVYWDAQDVLLEDVARIEVIRGPGATLWGANAVNGVINIITKHSEDTQGGLLTAGGGTKETGFGALRYGNKLGVDTYARAYIKGFDREGFTTPSGVDAYDAWHKQQGGFRLDSRLNTQDELTVQGDLYQAKAAQALLIPSFTSPYTIALQDNQRLSGWNITAKWQHTASSTESYKLQFYYDHYRRNEYLAIQQYDIVDVDFQHNFSFSERQAIIWGVDYRYTHDEFNQTKQVRLTPDSRGVQLFSGFVQDEIMLLDDTLWLTVGTKLEHNDYTGFEGQPTAKLLWSPAAQHRFWASFSRAVRTPARAESDIQLHQLMFPPSDKTLNLPVSVMFNGNPDFQAEVLFAYELGYRFTLNNKLSVDIAAFFNDYSKLRRGKRGDQVTVGGSAPNYYLNTNALMTNSDVGHTYGAELALVWQATDWWRWDINYSFLQTNLPFNSTSQGGAPQQQVTLRSVLTPNSTWNIDLWLRYVDSTHALNPKTLDTAYYIPGYLTLDTRVSWKPYNAWELTLVGQNLLDHHHLEYIEENFTLPVEISRGLYGQISWHF